MTPVKKLTISAMVIALYVVIMLLTQGFAFGQYQIRVATALYALSYLYPFLVLPLGLANLLSNTIMGGFGLPDMLGGFAAGVFTAGAVYLIRRFKWNAWFTALPVILIPGLLVPVWLTFLLKVPYLVLAASLLAGQIIPGILGVIIIKQGGRVLPKYEARPVNIHTH